MPNWTYNTFEAPKKIIQKYLNENKNFDFNLVIPMPESLRVESGGSNDRDIMVYLTDKLSLDPLNSLDSERFDILDKLVNNFFSQNWIEEIWNRCLEAQQKNELDLEESYNKGKILVDNYLNYGASTWYEWCTKNWGTKWNACDCQLDPDFHDKKKNDMTFVNFCTAWCMPYQVMKKIFEENDGVKLRIMWVNEDYDGEHYITKFKNGNYRSDLDGIN